MVHLAALEAAATAQTGGGRGWRGRGKAAGREPLGRKGAGGRERSEGEKVETVGRKPR